jgi:hypothetical protein
MSPGANFFPPSVDRPRTKNLRDQERHAVHRVAVVGRVCRRHLSGSGVRQARVGWSRGSTCCLLHVMWETWSTFFFVQTRKKRDRRKAFPVKWSGRQGRVGIQMNDLLVHLGVWESWSRWILVAQISHKDFLGVSFTVWEWHLICEQLSRQQKQRMKVFWWSFSKIRLWQWVNLSNRVYLRVHLIIRREHCWLPCRRQVLQMVRHRRRHSAPIRVSTDRSLAVPPISRHPQL